MTKIVVGMSGGVDSSLTAALLAEQGHDVLGVYMENWTDAGVVHGCASWPQDRRDAAAVAKHLGIPFKAVDFEKEYRAKVIEYFFGEYAAGRTPNPDVLCNREIKFGVLLEWALEQGYDAVATGHYARIEPSATGQPRLLRGVDRTKDQSYFLCQLSRDQLRRARFPLGDKTKRWVREEAARRKLPVAEKPDSQGLCFVGQIDLPEFLRTRIASSPGDVVTADGAVLGRHRGAAFYTVGQRRGVGVDAAAVPVYVLGTDLGRNEVIAGYERDLYAERIETEKPHWVAGRAPKPLWHGRTGCYDVAIRYRMEPAPAKVVNGPRGLRITFDEAQRGPTPGQFAVLYEGEELVGSAVIAANPLLPGRRPTTRRAVRAKARAKAPAAR